MCLQGSKCSSFVPVSFQWFRLHVGAKKDGDDALLEPSDGEEEEGDVNKELDNLGLNDE
jgi:hypothetical protein